MIPAIIAAIAPAIGTLIDRLVPDKAEAERLKAQEIARITETVAQANLGQIDTNKIEAGHASVFVAGWRPFIGWTCGIALAWTFFGREIAEWLLNLFQIAHPVLPAGADDRLFELVMAMLGLAGLRSFEKLRGVTETLPPPVPKRKP